MHHLLKTRLTREWFMEPQQFLRESLRRRCNTPRDFQQLSQNHSASLAMGTMSQELLLSRASLNPGMGGPRLPPICARLHAQKLRRHTSPPAGRPLSQTNSNNRKCQMWMRRIGAFVHYLWKCKTVPWLWKTVQRFWKN